MKKFKIEGIPNFISGWYAFIARKSSFLKDIHKEITREVCSKISSGRLLDVGTGPGYAPIEIAKIAPNLEVTGIDISSAMVDMASRKAAQLGLSSRVKFKTANAASLPFEDGYFDFVISTLSLHHWLNPVGYINEIGRVLKKGGEVYVYDFWRDATKEARAEVRKRYGWFSAPIFLKIAKIHSISLKETNEILSSIGASFSKKRHTK